MASHARSLLTDILTALRAEHDHFDLSTVDGTKRVVIDASEPPVYSGPWVVLSAPQIPVGQSAITPLTEYEVSGTLQWWAFAPSSAESPEERAFDALDLAHDVVKALQAAHATPATYTTLGSCHEFGVSLDEVSGDASVGDVPFGVAMGTITYKALTAGGV